MEEKLVCNKCKVPLVSKQTAFRYLDHSFYEDVPRCPQCGQAYISEELARGRMQEVEWQLEDK